jgi:membrane protein YqaA with SNARE-associated domain
MNRDLPQETLVAVLRVAAGFTLLAMLVTGLGWALREQMSSFGEWFVGRFGALGIVAGTFLADGLHFPLPPQFYMLTGLAGGHAPAHVVACVLVGSELGGFAAFAGARVIGRSELVRRRVEHPRRLLARLVERRGYVGLAIAMLLPISFSLLCMASGAMRLPFKTYGVLAAMRVPRILLCYAVIALAWGV